MNVGSRLKFWMDLVVQFCTSWLTDQLTKAMLTWQEKKSRFLQNLQRKEAKKKKESISTFPLTVGFSIRGLLVGH